MLSMRWELYLNHPISTQVASLDNEMVSIVRKKARLGGRVAFFWKNSSMMKVQKQQSLIWLGKVRLVNLIRLVNFVNLLLFGQNNIPGPSAN